MNAAYRTASVAVVLLLSSGAPVRAETDVKRRRAPRPEPRYLLFWRSPEQVPALVKAVGSRGDGRGRILGFGLPSSTIELEKQMPERIRLAFRTARTHDVAVMLHFDFHIAWKNRPDLWNWWDPSAPGYDPANRANVEWFGWDGPPARTRYLNWGVPERMAPPMCFTSRRIRGEWARLVRQLLAPALKRELATLKREGRERLFAGVLVGSEPTFDDFSNPDPVTAGMMQEDGAPRGRTGYRALLDRGYSRTKPLAQIPQALAGIIQETVAYWCRQFVEAGIPASKLYPHVAPQLPIEVTGAPVSAAFNRWSRPGWTTYAVEQLAEGFEPLYRELRSQGNPPWAGVEANMGFPGSSVDWETYLGWHYNHGAVVVAVNTGATGKELPDRLEKSAFGADAVAAYRRFLSGKPLREKPVTSDSPQSRLRRKMRELQAAFQRWIASGKDPSPIARGVEQRLPPLLQAGRLAEAEAVIDEALQETQRSNAQSP